VRVGLAAFDVYHLVCRINSLIHSARLIPDCLLSIHFISHVSNSYFLPIRYSNHPSVFGRPFVKRFALCYRPLSCPVLSVRSEKGGRAPQFSVHVHCGQTAGWINMALGMQVGLGPGHIVLNGDPRTPLSKMGHSFQFSAHVYCGQTDGWIKMALGMKVGLGPGHIVLDGEPSPLLKTGAQPSPNFRPISVAAKWLHGSRCQLVWS